MRGIGPGFLARLSRSESEASNYVGRTIGHLTVSAYLGRTHGRPMMSCACICGETRTLRLSALKMGLYRSCGCHGLTPEESEIRDCFRDLITKARNRDLSMTLTFEEARALFLRSCHYCGRTGVNLPRTPRAQGLNISLNGIDRVDNSAGYIAGNVVACCGDCNHAKGTMTADAFFALCALIARRQARQAGG